MPLSPPTETFELLESLRFEPAGGYALLDRHLGRLERAARHFDYPYPGRDVVAALTAAAAGLSRPHKVRLLVDRAGAVRVKAEPIVAGPSPLRVVLAPEPVDPEDPFLYHKTTRRGVYERAFAARGAADDVLLWNPAGEVTEASSSNVVVAVGGVLLTPPVAAGLLPGTFRAALLDCGEIREATVRIEDLVRAEALYLINSVRDWRRAVYQPT